jgi:hypothetical protein
MVWTGQADKFADKIWHAAAMGCFVSGLLELGSSPALAAQTRMTVPADADDLARGIRSRP